MYSMKDIKDISFVGGFGSAFKIKINDYNLVNPDPLILEMDEIISYVDKNFHQLIFEILGNILNHNIEKYYIKNIDSKGINIIYDRSNFTRIPFSSNVYTLTDLKFEIINIIKKNII